MVSSSLSFSLIKEEEIHAALIFLDHFLALLIASYFSIRFFFKMSFFPEFIFFPDMLLP